MSYPFIEHQLQNHMDLTPLDSEATYYIRVFVSNSTVDSDTSNTDTVDLTDNSGSIPTAPEDPSLICVITDNNALPVYMQAY